MSNTGDVELTALQQPSTDNSFLMQNDFAEPCEVSDSSSDFASNSSDVHQSSNEFQTEIKSLFDPGITKDPQKHERISFSGAFENETLAQQISSSYSTLQSNCASDPETRGKESFELKSEEYYKIIRNLTKLIKMKYNDNPQVDFKSIPQIDRDLELANLMSKAIQMAPPFVYSQKLVFSAEGSF